MENLKASGMVICFDETISSQIANCPIFVDLIYRNESNFKYRFRNLHPYLIRSMQHFNPNKNLFSLIIYKRFAFTCFMEEAHKCCLNGFFNFFIIVSTKKLCFDVVLFAIDTMNWVYNYRNQKHFFRILLETLSLNKFYRHKLFRAKLLTKFILFEWNVCIIHKIYGMWWTQNVQTEQYDIYSIRKELI